MTAPERAEAPQYLVAHIAERLARDSRTAEFAVDVHVRGEDLFLRGPVCDDRHRLMVCQVATEAAHRLHPGLRVHDEMECVRADEPTAHEDLT